MKISLIIRFLFIITILSIFGCNEKDNEELITNNCPEWSASPSSPYFDPIWHPSGDIIGFNHMPLTEIDYTYGYDCPWQADYEHDIDSMGFWLINADGTNQTRVLPYYLQTPAWSPDGNWIAFSQGAQIFKMPFDGEKFDTANIVQLTFDGRNFFPSWSPDGEGIAYDSDMESLTGLNFIWKMKSDGSEKKRIAYTPTLGETRVPSWGINNSIVHERFTEIGEPEIFTMDTAGNNVIRITKNEERESYPKFSITADKIAYISQSNSIAGIRLYMINAQSNSNEELLTTDVRNFSWGPDGKHIVYINYKGIRLNESQGTLWIINIENNTKRQLTYNVFNLIQ